MINGAHHTSISTGNIDRLIAFYGDLLGGKVVVDVELEGPDIEAVTALRGVKTRAVMVQFNNLHIELFEYAAPKAAPNVPNRPVNNHGLTHICFDVTDVHGEYERLLAAGVEFHTPPVDLGPTVTTTYARDPDGNVVEFQEILTDRGKMVMDFEGSPIPYWRALLAGGELI
jgi:catechol 2,3-dioxygenase-like lactoylglutathione lyase family enzyme